jgi:hypothetical protein
MAKTASLADLGGLFTEEVTSVCADESSTLTIKVTKTTINR